jgi:FixJ family two-component response regulator
MQRQKIGLSVESAVDLKYTFARNGSSNSPETPVVFIVDDDSSVRDTVGAFIRTAGWRPITAGSAGEFLAMTRAVGPSCLLVELDLPDASGLDLQRRVLDRTEMPVIFMSSHAEIHAAVQAMKGGAFEFLTKPLIDDALLNALHDALERSRATLWRLAQRQVLHVRYQSLSRREREVMDLVVNGRLNKQVGGELGISEITVKVHRGRLMRKMHAYSVADLVRMAASLAGESRADATDLQVPANLVLDEPINGGQECMPWLGAI